MQSTLSGHWLGKRYINALHLHCDVRSVKLTFKTQITRALTHTWNKFANTDHSTLILSAGIPTYAAAVQCASTFCIGNIDRHMCVLLKLSRLLMSKEADSVEGLM